MKHVIDGREVAHLWAHQTQDYAKSQGNLYFQGDTIYSYGSHFPIARHIKNKKGAAAILFTTRGYSVTTSKHISYVRQAIPSSMTVFCVNNPMDTPTVGLLDELQTEINDLTIKAERSRQNKDCVLKQIDKTISEYHAFAEFIGSKRKPKIPDLKWVETQIELTKAQAEKDKAAKTAREAAKREKDQRDFEAWLHGGSNWFPSSYRRYNGTDYLRVEGDEVVTSSSARVPLEHVKKIVPFVLQVINEGKTYQKNGHTIQLGHYLLESIDEQGTLTVGCHQFNKAEIMRFAAALVEKQTCERCTEDRAVKTALNNLVFE